MASKLLWSISFVIQCLSVLGGIQKEILAPGDGKTYPEDRWTVMVHATEMFENGTVIESSRGRKPLFFVVGEAIPALNEGVKSMSKGEICELTATPDMAYGEQGKPGLIPPNSVIVFELHLVDMWDKPLYISLEDVVVAKDQNSN
ncbi:peptidyl-prolyl cis-trans isomerase FKBP1B-like [Saccostrea echinata]|uniref:peptidyl-prolyl cis-trans isomerase FKBP1B-like n=1 Tax=Saccostrea echinata TaxID=191078 RepID=UPI002A824220|nr:peptidyl-prolyl cis-trans isomerase FKBP1B-like [Saccostrea echinata]